MPGADMPDRGRCKGEQDFDEVVRTVSLFYLSDMDDTRNDLFWKQFPGLVWSNPDASNAVMIRAALSRPKTDWLKRIAAEFGIDRVRQEWRYLCGDPHKSFSAIHISFCNDLLERIEPEQYAH